MASRQAHSSASARGVVRAVSVATDEEKDDPKGSRFGVTLFRVMAVQVITLVLLWLMQSHFSAP